MGKHAKGMRPADTSMRIRRFRIIGVVAVVIVFAIAATAISMQASKGETPSGEKGRAGSNSPINRLPLRSGQDGQSLSPLTQAQIRPLTQEEAQQMAEGLKLFVNQSTEGLKQVQHADGSVSMDLQGRFQNVVLAKKADSGTVTQSCVDNPEAAAAFLGIERELIDGIKSSAKTRQPGQVEIEPSRGGQN